MAVCHPFINLLLVVIGTLPIASVRSAAVTVAPARTLANLTVTKVVTATQAATTTQSALLTCTTLAAPLLAMPVVPCQRRKRQQLLWGVPVFYTVAGEDIDQFHSLNPTHVFKVEPSALLAGLPEDTLGHGVEVPEAGLWVIPIVVRPAVEPSFDGIRSSAPAPEAFRFSAFLSSLLSGWQFPTIPVVTVTRTVYTATSTATLFTSTSVTTLSAAYSCLPDDFVPCPWQTEEEALASTDDPSIDIPSTDVL